MSFFLSKHPKTAKNLIETIKKELNDRGIIRTIMALLTDASTKPKTFICLIELSSVLLEGGNSQIQTSFFAYFNQNPGSQVFFSKINNFLISFPSKTEEYTKPTPIYKKNSSECKQILRFLQLLCENHNKSLQNYLRIQTQSQENYNLLTTLMFLLEELLKKSFDGNFLIISQCFDTLTEMIQGPCKENQIGIIDSKFLEIAGRLLSLDEKSDNMTKYSLLKEELLSTQGSRDEYSIDCLKG